MLLLELKIELKTVNFILKKDKLAKILFSKIQKDLFESRFFCISFDTNFLKF